MFDMIRNYSASPLEDQMKLWDICVFNYLVGNTDNHTLWLQGLKKQWKTRKQNWRSRDFRM